MFRASEWFFASGLNFFREVFSKKTSLCLTFQDVADESGANARRTKQKKVN